MYPHSFFSFPSPQSPVQFMSLLSLSPFLLPFSLLLALCFSLCSKPFHVLGIAVQAEFTKTHFFLKMVLKTEPFSSHFPTQNSIHHPVYVLYWFVCSFGAIRLNFWSWLLLVQYILPSAHCSAHLKLYINNENVQGLLAQVGRELHFLRLCFRALLCFWVCCASILHKASCELQFWDSSVLHVT